MSTTKSIAVASLNLDLTNFRTVTQTDEDSAIRAIIAIKPDYFWPLLESLLDDGYMPNENIIVLTQDGPPSKLIVKEGNRRIAALKLALGQKNLANFSVPPPLMVKIGALSNTWKRENSKVPCAVYPSADGDKVERIVSLIHGKNEKAGRNQWQPVAKARHNRDIKRKSEPGLDLLEEYIRHGRNINDMQRERWAGDFPITVLDEAIKKLAPRIGATNSRDMVSRYPSGVPLYRDGLEDIINRIGTKTIGFDELRSTTVDFAAPFGIPVLGAATAAGTTAGGAAAGGIAAGTAGGAAAGGTTAGTIGGTTAGGGAGGASTGGTTAGTTGGASTGGTTAGTAGGASAGGTTSGGAAAGGTTAGGTPPTPPAFSTRDPRAVRQTLAGFAPRGANRQKLVALKDEAMRLDLKKTPLAFCFLVRSMLEISSKAYSQDHPSEASLRPLKADGREKSLLEMLKATHDHLVADPTARGGKNIALVRKYHGAMAELSNSSDVLSITSMNSLVHHTSFTISTDNACIAFGNIYPLLEAMN